MGCVYHYISNVYKLYPCVYFYNSSSEKYYKKYGREEGIEEILLCEMGMKRDIVLLIFVQQMELKCQFISSNLK